MGLPNPSRETKVSGANGDKKISIFPFELTTSRTGNLTRLIIILAICDDHTYVKLAQNPIKNSTFLVEGLLAKYYAD